MECVSCGSDTKVVDSRLRDDNVVVRKRKCLSPQCGKFFHTEERLTAADSSVSVFNAIKDIRTTLSNLERYKSLLDKAYNDYDAIYRQVRQDIKELERCVGKEIKDSNVKN